MRIRKLTLPVTDVTSASRFFGEVLQLETSGAVVAVGWSIIELIEGDAVSAGGIHLAFNVPFNRFRAAKEWLLERCPLQRDSKGRDVFTFDENWDAESIYFAGPDASILELIARRRLPSSDRHGPFHGSEILCLSEVGLATSNVTASCEHMAEAFGIKPLGAPGEEFAALGDDEGLLIVTHRSRPWFPEGRQLPCASGLVAHIQTPRPGSFASSAEDNWAVHSE
ncbi:hypothetical protein B9Y64_21640 [Stenotrophomonas maltophilia]|uniref:VOC domain-containing protein n=1 Tax=Stenotrophomonas maltophilia TaxID=40324 RepID=A0A2J0U2X0_STEMA|nr:hypothetical protein B9Y64_21640 [Stenotrophomonas maltophilia]